MAMRAAEQLVPIIVPRIKKYVINPLFGFFGIEKLSIVESSDKAGTTKAAKKKPSSVAQPEPSTMVQPEPSTVAEPEPSSEPSREPSPQPSPEHRTIMRVFETCLRNQESQV
ncbi:hypothetical protein F4820DRAFT_450132 [Hypoxylon rubiginosum]|uniref:Uncharacterized protein n=1 Tax=Hypoxylon rubiginosum TaxID=110542 RepID=A0ACB9YVA3_9PEZI|nr:hypothetical protein F4820DRAFT_450132 [Hypoxylon rubiginosum]